MDLEATNHELIQRLAADVTALRAAVLALASAYGTGELLQHYDAASAIVMAQKQGSPIPDEYLELTDQALAGLRQMLFLATAGAPQR